MKEVKKSPAKKAAAKPAPVQKPVAKPAPKAAAVAKPAAQKKSTLSPEQRYKMIEETAYFVAERHGFNGDSAYFWSLAEAEVDNRLK
jgi:hypothetical protein